MANVEDWNPEVYERLASRPTGFQFIEAGGGVTRALTTILAERRFLAASAFPGDLFLVRVAWHHDERDKFVHLIDRAGAVHGSIRVGHSFPDVTASGRMWVTYGDQDDPEEGGIVCLDPAGRPLLKWNEQCDAWKLPWVFDCYASNVVSDEEAWFWYLDHGFTLVRMAGLTVDRAWQDLPVESSFAFAAANDRILFIGGRHGPDGTAQSVAENNRDHFHLVDLERMDLREFDPVSSEGRPLIPEHAFGRGPKLYFQDSGALYAVDATKLSV